MSTYCTKSNIEDVFGIQNVIAWSNLDNTTLTADTDRIARAIAVASERIDDVARVLNYAIPLLTASDATPVTVTDLAATLAGIWLYEARGSQDYNPETGDVVHRLEFKRQRAERTLEELRGQLIMISALKG